MFTLHLHKLDGGRVNPQAEYGHASTARAEARVAARRLGVAVEVHAADRCRFIVWPTGKVTPPEWATVPEREQHHEEGPCFCSACRAERAEARMHNGPLEAARAQHNAAVARRAARGWRA